MHIDNDILIDDLLDRVNDCTRKAKIFAGLTDKELRFKQNHAWNILECLEHLNLYGDFYLVEIEKRIAERVHPPSGKFRSGMIGDYFAKLMQVKDGKVTKMKSPKDKNPFGKDLSAASIGRFLKQQEKLIDLLNQSRHVDLTKTKCSISLTRFLRLRLGDTLRFFVYHIERHVLQAERMMHAQGVRSEEKTANVLNIL